MATAPMQQPTAIMHLAAMCQQASDEFDGADRARSRERDECKRHWLEAAATERFQLEQRLRLAMLSTAPTSLADALVLAINLSTHVPDVDDDVSYTAAEFEPIQTALQNIVIALADAQPATTLTDHDGRVLALWRRRASWRSLPSKTGVSDGEA